MSVKAPVQRRGEQPVVAPLSDLAFDSDLIEDGILDDAGFDKDGEVYPQRWWNAGPGTPQDTLILNDGRLLKPDFGHYTVSTPEERTTLLEAMRGRVWQEDLPPSSPDQICPHARCQARFRSTQAFTRHIATAHPTR